MSNSKVSQQSKTTVVLTMIALAFTLSSLPGLDGQSLDEGSVDLLSSRSCDIDGQIKTDGDADCPANVKATGVTGNVHIEKVVKTETTEAGYLITGEFSVKCSTCEDGVRTTTLESQFENLALAQKYLDEEAKKLAEETALEVGIEKCLLDQDGEKLELRESLDCHVGKMADLEDEKAKKRYYNNNLKDKLAELAQSSNPQDAALAAAIAGEIHKQLGVNCASTVAAAQQAQASSVMAQPFNPLANSMSSTSATSTPTDYIKESSCDVMMMANYNGRMMFLGTQLKGPNASAAAAQIGQMNSQWGNYFSGRGMVLNNPIVAQANIDAGTLMTSINDFNKSFSENYADIVKRHADMLGANQTTNTAGDNSFKGDPRLLRGGVTAENSNGGMPSVAPFPAMNNNNGGMNINNGGMNLNNGGMNLGNQFNGQQQAPAVLAPKLDAPVGS